METPTEGVAGALAIEEAVEGGVEEEGGVGGWGLVPGCGIGERAADYCD